jgi:CheY-like chemotaxis protein
VSTAPGVTVRTALVVDDSRDTRSMLRGVLEMNGYYYVVEAANGLEALEIARQGCPDLILIDLNMPELDGLATIQQVRELKGKYKDVPILAMTAYDTYGMKEAAIEAGCNEYLSKPTLEHLDQLLRSYSCAAT